MVRSTQSPLAESQAQQAGQGSHWEWQWEGKVRCHRRWAKANQSDCRVQPGTSLGSEGGMELQRACCFNPKRPTRD